jgi:hypothetical protein
MLLIQILDIANGLGGDLSDLASAEVNMFLEVNSHIQLSNCLLVSGQTNVDNDLKRTYRYVGFQRS